jgi:hypothetical protein
LPAQTDQDFDPGNRAVLLVEIRRALLEVVSNLVALIRRIDDPRIPAIGEWTVGDVAAHLALAFAVDLRAISARPLNDVPLKDVPAVDVPAVDVPAVDVPAVDVTVTPAGMAAFNRSSLLEHPNRDGKVLAAEIEDGSTLPRSTRPAPSRGWVGFASTRLRWRGTRSKSA